MKKKLKEAGTIVELIGSGDGIVKGPYTIKINGTTVNDVQSISFEPDYGRATVNVQLLVNEFRVYNEGQK